MTPLLEVHDLTITFRDSDDRRTTAVDGVSLSVDRGELVALVGESGCGKSLTGLAMLALRPERAAFGPASRVVLDGTDLLALSATAVRQYRGSRIAMVFQDPMSSLNPVMRVGEQITEAIRAHREVSPGEARQRAIALLREVGIADPEARVDAWPHQLSGGMRQRVMIAIALAAEPELLVADEPTSSLDATVQAQILGLLDDLRTRRGMAVLLITHDFGVVASRANRVLVMYAGRLVECANTAALFAHPMHPYTRGLLASMPSIDEESSRLQAIAGQVPPPGQWPTGCRFHPRCMLRIARCETEAPPLMAIGATHHSACWVTSLEAGTP
jgi:oligopeptide/dipeptide ABC transporter ATP-binding protein